MHLVVLSARSTASLDAMRVQLGHWLKDTPNRDKIDLGRLAYTLAMGRDHWQNRFAVVVSDLDDLIEQLLSDMDGTGVEHTGQAVAETSPHPEGDGSPSLANLHNMAKAYCSGIYTDLSSLYGQMDCPRVHLPGYAFDECRYWFETAADVKIIS